MAEMVGLQQKIFNIDNSGEFVLSSPCTVHEDSAPNCP